VVSNIWEQCTPYALSYVHNGRLGPEPPLICISRAKQKGQSLMAMTISKEPP
jgi:hypothetical protein